MNSGNTDLEDFFENGPIPLHMVRDDGTILRANRAELELLGYTAEEYVGRHLAEFHVDPAVVDDMLARLARGEKLIRYAAQLRARDGSIHHVQITSSGHFRDGRFVNTRCFTVDVTEAKRHEQLRQRSDRQWRAVLDALPTAIYTTDAEGRITYYNEAVVELSGRRPEIGDDQWCRTWRLFNLDGTPLPYEQSPMAVTLKENRAIHGEEAILERPDGTRVRFAPFPTPLDDEGGHLIGSANLLIDVTDQRAAEMDAARLAAIVLSSNDAIVSKTLDGIVTSWNDAAVRMFGYEPDEIVGQPITRIIPPELHSEEARILAQLRRGERIEHYETVRVRKDGRRLDVSLSVSPVRDRSGRLIGAAKVARDITQRKQAEEMKRLLLDELNHRVKNTLATVQSIASQTLRKSKSPAEFVASFLGRLQSLANAHTLLTQSNWQGAELAALIRSQIIVDSANEDRIRCSGPEVVLPPQLALHLALVLHELGTNARKHGALSSARGQVTASWSVTSTPVPSLQLEWRETGGPPVYVDAPLQTGFGTQLIERSIRSFEGGEAGMLIESQGISWKFKVQMPVSAPEDRPRVSPVAIKGGHDLDALPSRRSLPRILVIEDEPLLAMDMVAMLSDAGFQAVGPASSLAEAMQVAVKRDFDAVVLDANLGGKPVDELASLLTRANIPFAFVTGYGREGLPKAFASALMLAKPFSAAAFIETVRKLISPEKAALALRRDDRG
jgi:PAS domain S-box-containing protein